MPYEITKRGDMFEVVDDNGKRVGEHPTRKQATAQLRALYASVPDAKEADDIAEKGGAGSGRYPKGSGEGGADEDGSTAAQAAHDHAQSLSGDANSASRALGDKKKSVTKEDHIAAAGRRDMSAKYHDEMGDSELANKHREAASLHEKAAVALGDAKIAAANVAPKSPGAGAPPAGWVPAGALAPKGRGPGGTAREAWRNADATKKESIVDRVLSFLKEGRRNSTNDAGNLQQIHDLAVANGADCMFSIKEVNGAYRWVLLSSNSFQDTDREIVSLKALEADVARTDKEGGGNYGPLRWWHMGNPDPILRVAGAGVDIGRCDFRAMQGRTLIESGTFKDKRVALALKNRADDHLASIGFFHPMTEPDTHGVYSTIQIFERSVLPRLKASNQLTALTVKTKIGDIDMATMSEKWKEFVAVLGGDEALAKSVVKQAQDTEAQADSAGLKFKEGEAPAEAAPVVAEEKGEKPVFEKGKKPVFPKGKTDEEEPDGDEEDGEAKPEEVDKFKKKFMPAVKKEVNEMIAASRQETTEKEAGLEAQIVALTAQLKEQQNVIMTLAGDMPRGVRNGYRASLAESTLTKKESPNQPQADPLSDMYSWMTNSLAGHPGA